MLDSTERFSTRVENYVRYRPGYPPEIIDLLKSKYGLRPESVVADVGSGTGLLSGLFGAAGYRIFGIEPNAEMRQAGERSLGHFPQFTSVAGTAEQTTLPDASVDFITAGQAFHWFDLERSRQEFKCILRPGGWVVLIWNDRRTDSTPFLAAYEQLLRDYATDYGQVNHKRIDSSALRAFFQSEPERTTFYNHQEFDFESLRGRLLSSSYAPEPGQPGHEKMIESLRQLFETHEVRGRVTFEYDTLVYCGRFDGVSGAHVAQVS
jgi:SAM-dependent methyltransferase